MRAPTVCAPLLLFSAAALTLFSQPPPDLPGHASLASPTACVACHRAEADARWQGHHDHPCTHCCLTCHKQAEMANHHPVDHPVTKTPRIPLRLTQNQKSACFTCHDLSRHRYDSVRWKAESLFSRMFRKEIQHKTYYLVTRNDRGQLCLACH